MQWKNKISWLLFALIATFLGWYVLFVAQIQQAGDIAEYFGVTESVTNHGGVNLSSEDRSNLELVLHKAYFEMPGYYIVGIDGNRYPVHFWFYSLLAVPIRLILSLTGIDVRRSLYVVNWLSLVIASGWILKHFIKDFRQRIGFLAMVFTSALLSFLVWPGPDLWYLSLLLIVPFAFFNKNYWTAAILAAIASWHSQPLIILAAGLSAFAIYESWLTRIGEQVVLKPVLKHILQATFIGALALIPYAYNHIAFGVLSPWTLLEDGWTVLNGFGFHNASLWKFYEQWFDLNVGLFWYAPVVFSLALLGMWRFKKQKYRLWFFVFLSLLTAFFYQTNPAWHYGTVGFGPGRHGVYLLPILIFFALQTFQHKVIGWLLIALVVVTQVAGLSLNGYLEPDFTKTLNHSPYAEYVLERWPGLYNPTPEIFVDRTNHSDLDFPTSAIYKLNGKCKKAYILITDKDILEKECGELSASLHESFDNSYLRFANYEREIVTKEATFWPQSDACAEWFVKTELSPFECMKTEGDFLRLTGLRDANRLAKVPGFEYPGVWKVTWGKPVSLVVPPGYIINHYSMDGIYVVSPN